MPAYKDRHVDGFTMLRHGALLIALCLAPTLLEVASYGQKNQAGTGGKRVEKEGVIHSEDNFESLYRKGKEAYLSNDFGGCVRYIEAALSDYKNYTGAVNSCKSKCQRQNMNAAAFGSVLKYSQEDMAFFERLIKTTLCTMKCKRATLGQDRKEVYSEKTWSEIKAYKPYDYLQLCYFQTDKHQLAASAAFTNLVYNPDHEVMKVNLTFSSQSNWNMQSSAIHTYFHCLLCYVCCYFTRYVACAFKYNLYPSIVIFTSSRCLSESGDCT